MTDQTPEHRNELEGLCESPAELPETVVSPPPSRSPEPPVGLSAMWRILSDVDPATVAATATASTVVFREVVKQIGETKRERLRQDGATARALLRGHSADDCATPGDTAEQDEADT